MALHPAGSSVGRPRYAPAREFFVRRSFSNQFRTSPGSVSLALLCLFEMRCPLSLPSESCSSFFDRESFSPSSTRSRSRCSINSTLDSGLMTTCWLDLSHATSGRKIVTGGSSRRGRLRPCFRSLPFLSFLRSFLGSGNSFCSVGCGEEWFSERTGAVPSCNRGGSLREPLWFSEGTMFWQ